MKGFRLICSFQISELMSEKPILFTIMFRMNKIMTKMVISLLGYKMGTPALKPYKREINRIKMIRFCEKKQCKTGLAMNWKKMLCEDCNRKKLNM